MIFLSILTVNILSITIKRGVDMDSYVILLVVYAIVMVFSYSVIKPTFKK